MWRWQLIITESSVKWLVVGAVFYLVGFEVASRARMLVREVGLTTEPLCDRARICCLELQVYRWVSLGAAFIAATLALVQQPFSDRLMWVVGLWGVGTLYESVRVLRILRLAREYKVE